jgi:hypothetical protein
MNKFFSVLPFRKDAGLFIIRIIAGFFMIYHGWEIFSTDKMNEYLQWDQFRTGLNSKLLVYGGKAAGVGRRGASYPGLSYKAGCDYPGRNHELYRIFIGHGKIWYEDQHPFLFVLLVAVFFFTGRENLAWTIFCKIKNEKCLEITG